MTPPKPIVNRRKKQAAPASRAVLPPASSPEPFDSLEAFARRIASRAAISIGLAGIAAQANCAVAS